MSSYPVFVNDMNLFGNHIKQIPCIVGEGSPTSDTYGAVGMLYMDSSNNGEMYKCIKVEDNKYTWETLISENSGENAPLTAEERSTLIAVINAIKVFEEPNGNELLAAFNAAWGGPIEPEPDEPVAEDNISQSGSVLVIISTAADPIQTNSTLTIM